MLKKILIGLFFIFALPLGLQAMMVTSVGNNLLADIKPASPEAGGLVTINLTAYGFDIDTSAISWFINDQLKWQSVGNKTYSFNLGAVGERTKVVVMVKSSGGQQSSKTFVFDPAEVELFWEAQTSAPLFYQGKTLPSAGANLKITAWPYLVNRSGQKIDPAKLTYRWQKDGVAVANLSGLGKNSITIQTDPTASLVKIGVEVSSPADELSATKGLIVSLVKPEIVFYEKKPLEGVNYGQTFPTEYSLFGEEVTVKAEPYFLPLNTNLIFKYLWTLDQTKAEGRPDDPLAITLRRSQNTSGSNRINFSTQVANTSISNSFTVKYGNSLLKPQN
jgi:hypothetical protein